MCSMPADRLSRFGAVNAYLVAEDDGLTLIDTMLPRSGKRIVAAAEALGAPIVRILLTHAHGDHVGSLDELHAALPEAEVIISARDARLLAKDMSLDPGEPDEKLRGQYPGAETKPDREIAAGDRIGSLEAIAAPGHTPGQLAFLDHRDGTLYCADAYTTLFYVATTARPNLRFPFASMATWHRPTALESARTLRARNPKALAPGHGKVVDDPGIQMDVAIDKAARTKESG
jgi:glyoxylase-like metal-dependent hydrolase (beta-lactamase superfamily II)